MSVGEIILSWIFWICVGGGVWAYVAYPVVIAGLGRWVGWRRVARELTDGELPRVTMLIAAYNEEEVIEERVKNALQTRYPQEKFEVVVASDGSSDATASIVRQYAGRGVRLLDYRERRGKASVLNSAMEEIDSEVVVLSDANTMIEAEGPRKLARWFVDERIGAVCGRLVLTDPATGKNTDGLYWKYETFLKKCESRLGALLGSNGAIYGLRRKWFVPIPAGTIVDDFVIPLLAKLRHGCEIVYDSEAVGHEETPADVKAEFGRRARIGAGGFQSVGMLWRLLDPRRGWIVFTFWSHKILRWLCPFFMVGALVSSAALWRWPVYRWALGLQVAFYVLAGMTSVAPAGWRFVRPLRLTTLFVGMNAALGVGFYRWMVGGQKAAWKRTAREDRAERVAG